MSVTHSSSVQFFFHAKNRLQAEQPASFRDTYLWIIFFSRFLHGKLSSMQ